MKNNSQESNTFENKRKKRQHDMADTIFKAGSIQIEKISEKFNISLMTAHRDLDELESQGLIRKTRGVASAKSSRLAESSEIFRQSQGVKAKEALVAEAAKLIEPGQAIILDDSTTSLALLPHLLKLPPLTIITNYLSLITELNNKKGISVVAIGGDLHGWSNSFMGGMAIDTINSIKADHLIMSTAAIIDDVCYHPSADVVKIKQAMIKAASHTILLADHSKFERRGLHKLHALVDFDTVIIDEKTPIEIQDRLRNKGVGLKIAKYVS